MNSQNQTTTNGGTQSITQIVYLDFDGELTKYRNPALNLDIDVTVEDSCLSLERIRQITDSLNEQYASQNVHFVTERPEGADYSTIYIGKTSSFSQYGTFAGLAEAIDYGNQNQSDNAFVILDSTSDNAQIISTISHELDHLLGTLDHGGEGLERYASGIRYDVSSGVTSTGISLNNDSMYVSNGGVANDTIVNAGGYLHVSNGGTANNTTVNFIGNLNVSKGGSALNVVNSGGIIRAVIAGSDKTTVLKGVNADGTSFYISKGVASNISGSLDIQSGGTANNTTVNAYAYYLHVSRGGVANKTTIDNGGNLHISSGGVANSTTVNGWGNLYVSRGGMASCTTVNNGGFMSVSSGGMANSTIVNSGAKLYVSSGGSAWNVVNSGGVGGVVTGGDKTTLLKGVNADGTSFYISKGVASNISGSLDVHRGGVASSIKIGRGDKLYISGGSALDVVNSGGIISAVVAGGDTATLLKGVNADGKSFYISGGVASNISGNLDISSGGVANETTIGEGGILHVSNGGTANNTTVNNGAVYVSSGGVANETTVDRFGYLHVSNGGVANDTMVDRIGNLHVSGGGIASNTTVNSAGNVTLISGGIASTTAVNSGGRMIVSSGGIIRGSCSLAGQLTASGTVDAENAVINFAVDQKSASDGTYCINDISLINGASYTITVAANQTLGTYCLAQGASAFAQNITLKNTEETILGTLSSGKTITVNDTKYTLNNDGSGNLTLTVESEKSIRRASSDVDGNGVSDVVFQWTGGDYQIGFWMNGTNNWQGQGIGQPSNWELIGAYDMDQNGKADLVMRGDIQIGEDKGAYIGYYKDGDVTQWQNISFLNNPGDVDWKLAVGNVTGNENCNSIVWHAPELGALGVWTDGTANWVSLAGGFDSNWTMLGCGDFDGNGKDEVLFSNAGNLYTTDIDQNFASLGGWGVEWEVKAIGDFAGDGKDDIIVQNGNIIAKFKDGKAENWESVGVMDSSDWFIVGAGDYNGDQKDDLLVRQYSTGMLGYYESGDMSKWVEMGRGVDMNWTVIA